MLRLFVWDVCRWLWQTVRLQECESPLNKDRIIRGERRQVTHLRQMWIRHCVSILWFLPAVLQITCLVCDTRKCEQAVMALSESRPQVSAQIFVQLSSEEIHGDLLLNLTATLWDQHNVTKCCDATLRAPRVVLLFLFGLCLHLVAGLS